MKLRRRLLSLFAKPLLKGLMNILWLTCRVKAVIGEDNAERVLAGGKPVIPCYWHQHHIFGIWYMLQLRRRGLRVGFLISPSRDGEVPAKIAESWGLRAIRGSSHRTGARALKELYELITKEGISPVNTSDGPTGPIHKFKPGAIMLAQMSGAPILPISWAADRYWQLASWDRFIIPKPFSRIVIAVGEPRHIDRQLGMTELEPVQQELEQTLQGLTETAEQALQG
ncbi:MAG: lysophospholipid acyltransferase family protein [Thiohalophilus sp.]|uniref:lysophospholipid acyltransferase family protein n=1 Tax=Thiohalophilus sp. TaxID=3028392 RepID=UPI00286FF87F|nr:lysophospholipid acyltransferase family protein [Thiohalophilus sp.]MDR9435612.1 lysophospholipid acyltransferase family protein [Thiohalophilus sp.]